MARFLKRAALVAGALLLLVIAAVISLGRKPWTALVEQAIIGSLKDGEVALALEESEVYLTGIRAHRATITIPKKFLFFTFDDVDVRTSLFGLLTMAPRIEFAGKAYR